MNKSIMLAASAVAVSLLCSCAADDAPAVGGSDAAGAVITVNAVYPGYGESSRTSLAETDGNMVGKWAQGDKLLVSDNNGRNIGYLELVDGAGTKTASFLGHLDPSIPEGTYTFNFSYLGSGVDPQAVSASAYSLDFSEQNGKYEELNRYDVFTGSGEYIVVNGNSYAKETLQFSKRLTLAHFELRFPDGVSMASPADIVISGDNILTSAEINLADGTLANTVAGSMTVSGTMGDFYITLIPGANVTPVFTVTVGGVEYTGSLAPRAIEPGKFLRESHGVGIQVEMTAVIDPQWIDLGLPSGTLWRNRNIGAENEEDNGNYYGWGDYTGRMTSESASAYGPESCPSYAETSYHNAYPSVPYYWICSQTHSQAKNYDIAYRVLGDEYAMPTVEQVVELMDYTNYSKTTYNGKSVWKFVNKSDNSKFIVIPVAGYKLKGSIKNNGAMYVWTSELDWYASFMVGGSAGDYSLTKRGIALTDYFNQTDDLAYGLLNPAYGFPVRPVRNANF